MDYSKRLDELAERSKKRKRCEYTDFLNETEQAEIFRRYSAYDVSAFGGADFSQRKVVRFGNGEDTVAEDFPVKILKITALGGKFGKDMTHRDVLGSVMSLGVERNKVGDIFVGGNTAYVALYDTVFTHVLQSLNKVGGNFVKTETAKSIPCEFAPKTELLKIVVQSNRLDAVICRVYNLSRDKANELISAERVFINGESAVKSSKELNGNDVVSARGYGKFKFIKACGESRKGKTYFEIEKYI